MIKLFSFMWFIQIHGFMHYFNSPKNPAVRVFHRQGSALEMHDIDTRKIFKTSKQNLTVGHNKSKIILPL